VVCPIANSLNFVAPCPINTNIVNVLGLQIIINPPTLLTQLLHLPDNIPTRPTNLTATDSDNSLYHHQPFSFQNLLFFLRSLSSIWSPMINPRLNSQFQHPSNSSTTLRNVIPASRPLTSLTFSTQISRLLP
jgi:hypothetical protein